jgi:aldehyde dehydrogenase (NAD+)
MYIGMNYIDGDWCPTRPDFSKYNPSTMEPLGVFPLSTDKEVAEAVAAAQRAQKKWQSIGRVQRAEYFDRLCQLIKRDHDKIVKVISEETGKNVNESHAEVIEALHMTQYTFGRARMPSGDVVTSELPERDSYVIRKPKGVVAVISPWNFPFAIGGFWCAAPALLEGNTVVFKPSELTPMTGQLITQLYHEAGFPAGVFNLVHGDGTAGATLVSSDVNHICFTGSVQVGQAIRRVCAASRDKTCSCEMGSKSAVIVFDDCDIDLAVQAAVNSAFKLTGQRCVSAGRILVQRGVLENFKQDFVTAVSNVVIGDPFVASYQKFLQNQLLIGPLISDEQRGRVMNYAQMIYNDPDAKVLYNNSSVPDKGHYLGPIVYQCEWADKPFLKEEIFGPVVGIIPFDAVEDAIRIYNDTDYGLAVGVCTNDYRVMREMRDNCDAGMIYFNLGSIGAESHLPFSGVKMSGYGHGSAAATFDAVVHEVSVTYNHAAGVTFPQGLK